MEIDELTGRNLLSLIRKLIEENNSLQTGVRQNMQEEGNDEAVIEEALQDLQKQQDYLNQILTRLSSLHQDWVPEPEEEDTTLEVEHEPEVDRTLTLKYRQYEKAKSAYEPFYESLQDHDPSSDEFLQLVKFINQCILRGADFLSYFETYYNQESPEFEVFQIYTVLQEVGGFEETLQFIRNEHPEISFDALDAQTNAEAIRRRVEPIASVFSRDPTGPRNNNPDDPKRIQPSKRAINENFKFETIMKDERKLAMIESADEAFSSERKTEEYFRQQFMGLADPITRYGLGSDFTGKVNTLNIKTGKRDLIESVQNTEYTSRIVNLADIRIRLLDEEKYNFDVLQTPIPELTNIFNFFKEILLSNDDTLEQVRERLYLTVPCRKEVLEYISVKTIAIEKFALPFSLNQISNFDEGIHSGVLKFKQQNVTLGTRGGQPGFQASIYKDVFPIENLFSATKVDAGSIPGNIVEYLRNNIYKNLKIDCGPQCDLASIKIVLDNVNALQRDVVQSRKASIRNAQLVGSALNLTNWSQVLDANTGKPIRQTLGTGALRKIADAHYALYRAKKVKGKYSCDHLAGLGNHNKHLAYRVSYKRKPVANMPGVKRKIAMCVPDEIGNLTSDVSKLPTSVYRSTQLDKEQEAYQWYKGHRQSVLSGAGLKDVTLNYRKYVVDGSAPVTTPAEVRLARANFKPSQNKLPFLQQYNQQAGSAAAGEAVI